MKKNIFIIVLVIIFSSIIIICLNNTIKEPYSMEISKMNDTNTEKVEISQINDNNMVSSKNNIIEYDIADIKVDNTQTEHTKSKNNTLQTTEKSNKTNTTNKTTNSNKSENSIVKDTINSSKNTTSSKNNQQNNTEKKQEDTKVSNNKKVEEHKHAFTVNGGWFKTEEEAEKKVDEELEKWDKKFEEDIKNSKTEEEKDKNYLKNCPNGYETFRCSCGEYGLNFTYR